MPSAPHSTAAGPGALAWRGWRGDRLAAVFAAAVLGAWAYHVLMAGNAASERERTAAAGGKEAGEAAAPAPGEYVVAGYGGAPYTHPSDVSFEKPGQTDLTAHQVRWEGRPFKSPVYYGIRTVHWSGGGTFGSMLDFTHSKTISQRDQTINLTGTRNGQNLSGKTRLGDVFRHFEFSHGHNTLTANGLVRLASLLPSLAPYLGVGIGVALPHTEVGFQGDDGRTYEYQYVGPAAQALLGLELRLPHASLFLEYKFTIARMHAPMTMRNGGWFPEDFWRQATDLWNGAVPIGGYLTTVLASHQVASGLGLRFVRAPVRPPNG